MHAALQAAQGAPRYETGTRCPMVAAASGGGLCLSRELPSSHAQMSPLPGALQLTNREPRPQIKPRRGMRSRACSRPRSTPRVMARPSSTGCRLHRLRPQRLRSRRRCSRRRCSRRCCSRRRRSSRPCGSRSSCSSRSCISRSSCRSRSWSSSKSRSSCRNGSSRIRPGRHRRALRWTCQRRCSPSRGAAAALASLTPSLPRKPLLTSRATAWAACAAQTAPPPAFRRPGAPRCLPPGRLRRWGAPRCLPTAPHRPTRPTGRIRPTRPCARPRRAPLAPAGGPPPRTARSPTARAPAPARSP